VAEKTPKDKNKILLELLDGDKKALEDFHRFQDREEQRHVKRELELKTQDILESDLKKENEKAIEGLNVVYRKAWTKACKDRGVDEAEFPSRY